MFDLDSEISGWRKKLAAQGIKSRLILDELESHLREDIEAQLSEIETALNLLDAGDDGDDQPH